MSVPARRDPHPVLYTNQGDGEFVRTDGGDLGRMLGHAACVAWGDPDHDGDLDAYIGNWPNSPGPDERNLFYRNDGATGHWLAVRLLGTRSNRAGIGARITVVTDTPRGPRTQVREVAAGTSWRSQNSLVQHFGLGAASEARSVTVRWPSGKLDELGAVSADQLLVVTEAAGGCCC